MIRFISGVIGGLVLVSGAGMMQLPGTLMDEQFAPMAIDNLDVWICH